MSDDERSPKRLALPTDWHETDPQAALAPTLNAISERVNGHDDALLETQSKLVGIDSRFDVVDERVFTHLDIARLHHSILRRLVIAVSVEGVAIIALAVTR